MSRSYDIFLSHSGAQKEFVEHLNAELGRVCGHYSVFFDRDAIQHGDQISIPILEHAKQCKLAVAVLSEEYFTKSRWPMMELAASYIAAEDGNGVPCLFPVFLAIRPEDAKDHNVQLEWQKTWQKWELNEKMSERRKSRTSRVQPTIWKEAVDRLLDTRGPIYKPHENEYDPEIFLKKVAQLIAHKLDVLSRSLQQDEEVDCSKDTCMVDFGKNFNTMMVPANTPLITRRLDGLSGSLEQDEVMRARRVHWRWQKFSDGLVLKYRVGNIHEEEVDCSKNIGMADCWKIFSISLMLVFANTPLITRRLDGLSGSLEQDEVMRARRVHWRWRKFSDGLVLKYRVGNIHEEEVDCSKDTGMADFWKVFSISLMLVFANTPLITRRLDGLSGSLEQDEVMRARRVHWRWRKFSDGLVINYIVGNIHEEAWRTIGR